MSSVLRRHVALGACVVGCGLALTALTGSSSFAARAKPAPKAAAAAGTTKGKVATFVKNVLVLTSGKQFKLDATKTKVLTSRGAAGPTAWSMAMCPGDDVVVTSGAKGAISVKVAPPVRIPSGEYVYMQRTKYTHIDPKTQETKDIALLWLKSAKGVRFVVELVDETVLTGEGVSEEVRGGQAIIDALQPNSVVQITASAAAPTVDKYGDPETVVRVNGIAKAVKVVQLPAAG